MYKYQNGGQATYQLQMNEIFLMIAQSPKEALQMLLQLGAPVEQILQLVLQQAQAGNLAAVEALNSLQQLQQMAREGTKLQYIRRIKGGCPEGYEMQIFKKGGSIGCGCKKKKAGGEINESVTERFKKDRAKKGNCGLRFPLKAQDGGTVKSEFESPNMTRISYKHAPREFGLNNSIERVINYNSNNVPTDTTYYVTTPNRYTMEPEMVKISRGFDASTTPEGRTLTEYWKTNKR